MPAVAMINTARTVAVPYLGLTVKENCIGRSVVFKHSDLICGFKVFKPVDEAIM